VCSAIPELHGISGVINYLENGDAVQLLPTCSVIFSTGNLAGATVTISNGRATDFLHFQGLEGIHSSFDTNGGGSRVLTLSGSASAATYGLALKKVFFETTGEMVDTHDERNIVATVSVCHTDAVCSEHASLPIRITPINDLPTVSVNTSSLVYTQNDAPKPIAADVVLADPDHTVLTSASINMADSQSGDVLDATAPDASITVSWVAESAMLALSGTASVAKYQETIRSLTFHSSASPLTTTARSIGITINDGHSSSYSAALIALSICADVGHFSNATNFIAVCPRGKYQGGTCSDTCTGCSPGHFGGLGAVTSEDEHCESCPAGQFQHAWAQQGCTECDAGSYGTGDQSLASYCQPCALGSYTNEPRQTDCTSCAFGTYAASTGMTACLECSGCPSGTYYTGCTAYSNTVCATCAAGKYSECPAESGLCHNITSCTPCVAGTFGALDDDVDTADHCQPCAAGRSQSEQAMTYCFACAAGTAVADTGSTECVACDAGRYQTETGQPDCATCAAGTFGNPSGDQTSADYCTDCPHGQFTVQGGLAACTQCGAGKYADIEVGRDTVEHCVPCPAGQYQDENTFVQQCKSCEVGQFQSHNGQVQCNECDVDACPTSTYVSDACDSAGRTDNRVCSAVPALEGISGIVDYAEGQSSVQLAAAAEVTFLTGNLTSATVSIANGRATDMLSFTGLPGITAAFDVSSEPRTLTLSGSASAATYSSVLSNVYFETTGDMVDTHDERNIVATVSVCHADSVCSDGASLVIRIMPINDLPTVSASTSSVAYTQNGAAALIAPDVVLADPDHTLLQGATVTLSDSQSDDVLTAAPTVDASSISTSWDGDSKVLTLSGLASLSLYQLALRTVTFDTSATVLSTGDRKISIVIDDGHLQSQSSPFITITVCAAAGSFNNGTHAQACPSGSFQADTCALACTSCEAGKFGAGGLQTTSTYCEQCAEGSYQPAAAQNECIGCAAGKFGSGTVLDTQVAESYCEACAEGSAQESTGQTSCTACAEGSYAGAVGVVECSPCPGGTYSDEEGMNVCQSCGTGTYSAATGAPSSTTCTPCMAASYAPTEGLLECLPVTSCAVGEFNFGSSVYTAGSCQACPTGKYQDAETSAAEECMDWASCQSGTYIAGNSAETPGTCELCAAGHYRDASVSGSYMGCEQCSAGKYAEAGGTSPQSCIDCEAGSYAASPGSAACDECEEYSYSEDGATSCDACAYGQWQEWSECSKTCEGGTKSRVREVLTAGEAAQEQCPVDDNANCNMQPCPHRVHCQHLQCRYEATGEDDESYAIQVYHHHKDAPAVHHCKLYNELDGTTACHCHCWSTLPDGETVDDDDEPTEVVRRLAGADADEDEDDEYDVSWALQGIRGGN
jgi:hypothetical protein